jgi:pantoate--beta-alanine ligase
VRTLSTIAELRAALDEVRAGGGTVGLVPTMGYLHEGHGSLIEAATADTDLVVTTIFVNPLQFAAGEDLSAYPRDLERDTALAESCGAGLLFTPEVAEMYPEPVQTTVSVSGPVTERMEGASRPTHFAGVATVVAKLFAIAGPCRAYFGEKDWQQVAVVRRMARDLSMPVEVVACPTVREADGLALSSRNVYLTAEERAAAPVVHRALQLGVAAIEGGERSARAVQDLVAGLIAAEPLAELDYAEVSDAATLAPVDPLTGDLRLLAAARFGRARLIDNVGVAAY